jgi:hypothetical protein
MHAPQSQLLSSVHARRSQWWGDVELALQSVLTGHLNAPPSHETAEQPFGSRSCPAPQVQPSGHLKPSVSQRAIAQPLASAPARAGAQTLPVPQVNAAPHGTGWQNPLAMSHARPAPHDVLVQRGTHFVPRIPPIPQAPGAAATQSSSPAQPASPGHSFGGGSGAPPHWLTS